MFQAENHVCYTIYDARSPTANPAAGKYAARYLTSLNPKLNIGFTEKQVALCEAEVGTGKTLSYLVAAIVAKHHNGITYRQNLPVTITTLSQRLESITAAPC